MITIKYKMENKTMMQIYIKQLSESEKMALQLAEKYLKSSFDIEKSIGFRKWKKSNQ